MMLGKSSPNSSTTSVVSMVACPDSQTLPAASVTGPAMETTRVPAAAARASPPIERAQPTARAKSERRNDDPILVIEFLVRGVARWGSADTTDRTIDHAPFS